MTGREVVEQDLEDICSRLKGELAALQGKRLFVSGGAGFLGYYIIQAALHWNATRSGPPVDVVACDNFIRGVPAWLSDLVAHPALTLVKHDITTPLPRALGDFDFVVHAASIASPTYYRKHPIETMDANVTGLRLLLDRCREQHGRNHPLGGMLFFSTSEIYGDPPPDQIPTPETYRGNVSCTGPRACYDESKRFGETLCVNFAREFGLPVTIARPFNNYGPGLKITDRRVIADFARDIIAGRDLVLLSDGGPTRTFCYVADAVVGYYKILVRGRGGRAVQHRQRRTRALHRRARHHAGRPRPRAARVSRARDPADEPRRRLSQRQPAAALSGHREGARRAGIRAAVAAARRARPYPGLVSGQRPGRGSVR